MTRTMSPLVAVAMIAVLGTIFIAALAPRIGPDFWWHVRAGQLIVDTASVPHTDPFSFTKNGQPWINHEWLAQVVLYEVARVSVWGPFVLTAIVITAAYAFVFARMKKTLASVVLLALAFYAGSMSWGPRVQIATLLFAAIYAYALERRTRAWLVAMPLLMLVWTNVHGGFIVGLAMMAIVLIGERTKPLAISFAAAVVAAAVNPNGVEQFLYPLKFLVPNPFTRLIMESASPDFHLRPMLAFELLLLIALAAAMFARKRMRVTDVLMLVAFTHLALSQSRNVALWAIVATPIVADLVNAFIPEREAAYDKRAVALAALLALAIPLSAMRLFFADAPAAIEAESFPQGAVAFLRAHELPANLFTSYEWGGYAIAKLWPRYRVFIDSRADTVYDARVLDDYWTAFNGSPQWREIFARRNVTAALVPRRSFIAAELRTAMNEWTLVYLDERAALFVRRR